ncbi:MAG TPA: hypothetical protein VE172_14470 [Stackebrandtia sp.]|jgi:hypothetical protein|uniref:hypothetical protein n=1 Tax=Stackebrandtia sp. TaxID=2023065 RepID=UPI002D7536C3|nr:hypothetical protein [Stackebrandtia sp.]HZE40007.1 hypothetical protein [Stackebrandtia sp.]
MFTDYDIHYEHKQRVEHFRNEAAKYRLSREAEATRERRHTLRKLLTRLTRRSGKVGAASTLSG